MHVCMPVHACMYASVCVCRHPCQREADSEEDEEEDEIYFKVRLGDVDLDVNIERPGFKLLNR
jgi:hypothetical protein